MNLIEKNLKKAGIFNTILILFAIALRIFEFINVDSIVVKTNIVICLFALCFGLFYCFTGYKKESAKYYKFFMLLSSLNSLLRIFSETSIRINIKIGGLEVYAIVLSVILICNLALTFVNDLGQQRSSYLAYAILILNIILLAISLLVSDNIFYHIGGYANLVMSCIICVFVSAKYRDKQERGTY